MEVGVLDGRRANLYVCPMTPPLRRYSVPDRYGDAAAVQAMTSVAAPLLSSGALVFVGLVLESLRYPGLTLLVMVGAVVALVTAIQCGVWARQFASTPQDIEQWWSHLPEDMRAERASLDQRQDLLLHDLWANRARWAYDVGIVLLWLGVAAAVVPCADAGEPLLRWMAVAVGVMAAVGELMWLAASRRRGPGWLQRWLSPPASPPSS
jgi:hypothetical protein